MHVCMYACIYAYVYTCRYNMYIYMCVYIYIFIYVYTHIHIYICVCVYIYLYMYTHIYTYIYIHIYIYIYIHICMHIHIHTYTYTYTYIHMYMHVVCSERRLSIKNTWFQKRPIQKYIRKGETVQEGSLIDYVLVKEKRKNLLEGVDVYRGAAGGLSDHYLVEAKAKMEGFWKRKRDKVIAKRV